MSNYAKVVESLRNTFNSGRTKNVNWRKAQLASFYSHINANQQRIIQAIEADLHKPKFETILTEVNVVLQEIHHALDEIDTWVKPQKVEKSFMAMMNDCTIKPDPLGVAFVIGAWNFPFMLSLAPLVAAIAAGNCCIVKPSELSPHTATVIQQLVEESLDEDAIRVFNGDAEVCTALLACKFDHIFYTGGGRVGRIVMRAAAENLTPVTLELGGKNPCFVNDDCDFEITANRIVWAKMLNNGQVCLDPDYILTTRESQPKLIAALKKSITEMYGVDIERNKDYGRIVSDGHFKRLQGLLKSCESKIVFGGQYNAATRFMEPTIVADVTFNDEIMKDEVFGPILPIVVVENSDEAINYINGRNKSLALYVFAKDRAVIDKFLHSTSSGSFAANDCLMQITFPSMPFGGVGESGTGAYHGKHGFDTFSHLKASYIAAQNMEAFNNVRYAPFCDEKLSVVSYLPKAEQQMSWLPKPLVWGYLLIYFLIRLATLPKRRPRTD